MANITLYPTTGQNHPGDVSGGDAWTNPGNIVSDNGTSANVNIGETGFTRFLEGRGFGFNIPSNLTIKGIVAEIEMYDNSSSGMGQIYKVQLMKNGSYVGNEKGLGTSIDVTPQVYSFGSSTDMWGTTWTPADINSASFGVGFAAMVAMQFSEANISVDFIRLNVYHSDPSILGASVLSKTIALVAKGTSAVPKNQANTSLSKKVGFVAQGIVEPPKFQGTANLSKSVSFDNEGVMAASLSYSETHLNKSVVLTVSGTTEPPYFEGKANLSKPVIFDIESTYTPYQVNGAFLEKPVQLVAIGTVEPPIFRGTANLSIQNVGMTNIAIGAPPFFKGKAFLSSKNISVYGLSVSTRMQSATLNLFIEGAKHESGGILELFVEGAEVPILNKMAIGSLPLYINSAYFAGGKLDLFVEGYSVLRTTGATMDIFLAADYPVIKNSLDLYLMADIPQISGVLPLYIRGAGEAVGYYYAGKTLDLFVEGTGSGDLTTPVYNEGVLELFIRGVRSPVFSTNNSLPIFLQVAEGNVSSNTLDLFIEGANPNSMNANLDLVIPKTFMRATLPLFIRGI